MIDRNIRGQIVERQTTFLRFLTSDGTEYKVTYIGKKEFRIKDLCFRGFSVVEMHPLLEYYQFQHVDVFISSRPATPLRVANEIEMMVKSFSCGWRSSAEFFNPQRKADILLEEGFGLLFSGPVNMANKVTDILELADVTYSIVSHRAVEQQSVKALIFGRNAIVASDFLIS